MSKDMNILFNQLLSSDPAVVSKAVSQAETRLKGAAGDDKLKLLEALLQLFYLDLYDRPEILADAVI